MFVWRKRTTAAPGANPPQFQENSAHTIAKKTTVSTKHLNFTASPLYFTIQHHPHCICHWYHYYNLCLFEGPSYSRFIERLSIQKQTPKKNYDVGKIINNIFRRIEYGFQLDAFLKHTILYITYPAGFVRKLLSSLFTQQFRHCLQQ